MSTSAVHAHPESSWKQEVNRRLAEHRGRKPETQPEPQAPAAVQTNASRRAQEAAARVAARYAKAPSYSEVLATEARAALRAAEAASEAALQAKAAAQSLLDNIEAAMPHYQPEVVSPAAYEPAGLPFVLEPVAVEPRISPIPETIADHPKTEPMDHRANDGQSLSIRWASELPARHAETAGFHTGQGQEIFQEDWWKPVSAEPMVPGAGEIEMVDPALPIYGNLIEFPRELVATRKVRPRLSESPLADASHMQLSIFEVDPGTIATEPSADAAQASASDWTQPSWSGLELDEQPYEMYEELLEEPAPRSMSHELQTASFNRRVMAFFVDSALIAGAIVSAAALVLNKATVLPSPSTMEHISIAALLVISALYITLFYAIAPATPGMKYAGLRFCTFEGLIPTRSQRWARLGAMLLSVLPAGLGLAWSLFDENNLSWHDRLSRTYICNS